jgi:hypothetical protein
MIADTAALRLRSVHLLNGDASDNEPDKRPIAEPEIPLPRHALLLQVEPGKRDRMAHVAPDQVRGWRSATELRVMD